MKGTNKLLALGVVITILSLGVSPSFAKDVTDPDQWEFTVGVKGGLFNLLNEPKDDNSYSGGRPESHWGPEQWAAALLVEAFYPLSESKAIGCGVTFLYGKAKQTQSYEDFMAKADFEAIGDVTDIDLSVKYRLNSNIVVGVGYRMEGREYESTVVFKNGPPEFMALGKTDWSKTEFAVNAYALTMATNYRLSNGIIPFFTGTVFPYATRVIKNTDLFGSSRSETTKLPEQEGRGWAAELGLGYPLESRPVAITISYKYQILEFEDAGSGLYRVESSEEPLHQAFLGIFYCF